MCIRDSNLETCQTIVAQALEQLEYNQSAKAFVPDSVSTYVTTARPLLSRMSRLRCNGLANGPAGLDTGSVVFVHERRKAMSYSALAEHIEFSSWGRIRNVEELYQYLEDLVHSRAIWKERGKVKPPGNQVGAVKTPPLVCNYCKNRNLPHEHDYKTCQQRLQNKGGGKGSDKTRAEKRKDRLLSLIHI